MTVFVDNMKAKFGNMIMCHMIADTEAELHAMADAIGIARRWFQGDHYDISLGKRFDAVHLGAQHISWKTCGLMASNRKAGWPMYINGDPETAAMIFHLRRALSAVDYERRMAAWRANGSKWEDIPF